MKKAAIFVLLLAFACFSEEPELAARDQAPGHSATLAVFRSHSRSESPELAA